MSLKDGQSLSISEAINVMHVAVDELNRPLMEESSAPEAKNFATSKGIIISHEPNLNPDLRKGLPTNSLALADILSRREDFLADLVWIHDQVLGVNSEASIGRRALISSWVASCASSFGINRTDNPFPITAVPVEAAHLFKVSLGLRGVASGLKSESSPSGERYYQEALSNGLLIDGGISCPASRNLIAQSAEALVNGIGPKPSQKMDQLFPDFKSLQSYSAAIYIHNSPAEFPNQNAQDLTLRMNVALGRYIVIIV